MGREWRWRTCPPFPFAHQENKNCAILDSSQRSLKSKLGSKYEKTNISDPIPHIGKWLPPPVLSIWYLSLVPKCRNGLCFSFWGGSHGKKTRQGPKTWESNLGWTLKAPTSAELASFVLAYLSWEIWDSAQKPFPLFPLPSLTYTPFYNAIISRTFLWPP